MADEQIRELRAKAVKARVMFSTDGDSPTEVRKRLEEDGAPIEEYLDHDGLDFLLIELEALRALADALEDDFGDGVRGVG
jgi:hypothetical protein